MPRLPGPRWLLVGLREPVNSLTHLFGAAAALVGAVLLLAAADEPRKTISFAIYGASLVLLFSASALLHGAKAPERILRRLRILDHVAIFVLIAGSYTPVTLVVLHGLSPGLAVTLLVTVWLLALLGALFKLFWIAAPRWLSTGIYLALGWLAVLAFVPLSRALSGEGLAWLVAGGAFYSAGAVIYGLRRPDPAPGVFGYHEIWHLFVLAGAACHYLLMLRAVLPA